MRSRNETPCHSWNLVRCCKTVRRKNSTWKRLRTTLKVSQGRWISGKVSRHTTSWWTRRYALHTLPCEMYVLNIRSVPQLSAGLSHSTQFPKIFIHFVHLLKDIYSDHTEKPGRMTDCRPTYACLSSTKTSWQNACAHNKRLVTDSISRRVTSG